MYKKYFSEFYVPEGELRALVVKLLVTLSSCEPNIFPSSQIQAIISQDQLGSFIGAIYDIVPGLKSFEPECDLLNSEELLRVAGIAMRSRIVGLQLENTLLSSAHTAYASQFLAIRYLIASEMIANELHEELTYDQETVANELFHSFVTNERHLKMAAALAAEDEIARVASHERTQQAFVDLIGSFEDAVEERIRFLLPTLVMELLTRAVLESFAECSRMLEPYLGSFDQNDKRDMLESILHFGRKSTNERLGIRRGGARKTTKFRWTDDNKLRLYECMKNLARIDGKLLWEYAFEELTRADFDYNFIEYLRKRREFSDVPEALFRDAVRTWRKYLESFNTPRKDEKPKAFAMKHSLAILDFPDTKFSTLDKYLGEGKRLAKSAT